MLHRSFDGMPDFDDDPISGHGARLASASKQCQAYFVTYIGSS